MTYAAYHVDDMNGVILAIGANRAKVQAQAIRRVLTLGASWGGIQTQHRPDLADIAAETAASLDAFFAAKQSEQPA
jgi:hypothetical protein